MNPLPGAKLFHPIGWHCPLLLNKKTYLSFALSLINQYLLLKRKIQLVPEFFLIEKRFIRYYDAYHSMKVKRLKTIELVLMLQAHLGVKLN